MLDLTYYTKPVNIYELPEPSLIDGLWVDNYTQTIEDLDLDTLFVVNRTLGTIYKKIEGAILIAGTDVITRLPLPASLPVYQCWVDTKVVSRCMGKFNPEDEF